MRQVPFSSYLIIGSGRMASHFVHYLSLLNLPYRTWSRNTAAQESLTHALEHASHIVVLIKDSAIIPFVNTWQTTYPNKRWVHFSGQLTIPHIIDCHPLMTFTEQLYDLATYQAVPFILSDKQQDFTHILPGLPNSVHIIEPHLKTYYHALCVISGNFTCLVWQKLFAALKDTLQIPPATAIPYLKQIMQNIVTDPTGCLTGPLVRGDQATINAHQQALQADDFLPIYQAVVHYFKQKETV